MKRHTWPVLVAAVALLMAVQGCARQAERPCTLVAGSSGVSVGWHPNRFPDLRDATYELCVDRTCSTTTEDFSRRPLAQVSVDLPTTVGEARVKVHLTARREGASVPYLDESREATLTTMHPNGAACPPTLYRASLTLDPEKGLELP
ncbi:hypothetical protein [Peterkaempfera griseoplana]|uniref:hypothetical protein n=1 Tax=Peterkaempfera griseoplana TaxID=66896 RepID=UPI0006E2EB63|nr:hypothetical protein [Peterkaempfera griseoplana]